MVESAEGGVAEAADWACCSWGWRVPKVAYSVREIDDQSTAPELIKSDGKSIRGLKVRLRQEGKRETWLTDDHTCHCSAASSRPLICRPLHQSTESKRLHSRSS